MFHVQVVVFITNKASSANVLQINFGQKLHVLLVIYLNISTQIWKNVLAVHQVWLMIFLKIYVLTVLLINLTLMDLNAQHARVQLIIVHSLEHVPVVHTAEYTIIKVNNANALQESSLLVIAAYSVTIQSISI